MNYSGSINYLNSFLNFERILWTAKPGSWNLTRMRLLLDLFEHPEKNFTPVIIAGTKGKGSTGFFLESILNYHRIKVGFYHSPHLMDVRERIRIGGRMVTKQQWLAGFRKIKEKLKKHTWPEKIGTPTYFEILTLLAALVFQEKKVEVGIFEIGMGGRFDAANAIQTDIAILTPIDFDHEAILGSTLSQIAGEKAAIIHERAHVISSPQHPEAQKVIRARMKQMHAKEHPVRFLPDARLKLRGDFQKVNASVALEAARLVVDKEGKMLNKTLYQKALMESNWSGRFETVPGQPEFLLDVAHNPSSARALERNLKRAYPRRRKTIICGLSRDKNADLFLSALASASDTIIITRAQNARSLEIEPLTAKARKMFRVVIPMPDMRSAIEAALAVSDAKDMIVITGSFYLVGEAIAFLKEKHEQGAS